VRSPAAGSRVPPGQYVTDHWPVLHYGPVPRVDLAAWRFRVFGAVEEEQVWDYEAFRALGRTEVRCDVHCVTRWTRLDNRFAGASALKNCHLKWFSGFSGFSISINPSAPTPV